MIWKRGYSVLAVKRVQGNLKSVSLNLWADRKNSPFDEEGTAAAKRGRGGQTLESSRLRKILQLYDLPALAPFGRPLPVRRGIGLDLTFDSIPFE
jgi:hypothetical protein